ncbi:6954_t:CDS:1, partial [Dentiscutata erythropus]
TLNENLPCERSGFGEGTPKCYIRLAKRSLESDQIDDQWQNFPSELDIA